MTGINGRVSAKVIAITGASIGIGEATGRLLAEGGATVVLGARRTERLDEIAREIRDRGGVAVTCRTDIAHRADLERLVATAVDEFGRLDVLVSNAGVSKIGPISDLDVDGWSAPDGPRLAGYIVFL
ncbi:SDR family oxidoreductase [Mycobacterium sp.]|uniref:SDR family oxidoreductase n=1 Tax=Mycobacterium sp. TaxID=1785 RepID=UPI003C73A14B